MESIYAASTLSGTGQLGIPGRTTMANIIKAAKRKFDGDIGSNASICVRYQVKDSWAYQKYAICAKVADGLGSRLVFSRISAKRTLAWAILACKLGMERTGFHRTGPSSFLGHNWSSELTFYVEDSESITCGNSELLGFSEPRCENLRTWHTSWSPGSTLEYLRPSWTLCSI